MKAKKKILQKMKELNITQTHLAKHLHIAQKTLSKWLDGRGKIAYEKAFILFEYLGIEK